MENEKEKFCHEENSIGEPHKNRFAMIQSL